MTQTPTGAGRSVGEILRTIPAHNRDVYSRLVGAFAAAVGGRPFAYTTLAEVAPHADGISGHSLARYTEGLRSKGLIEKERSRQQPARWRLTDDGWNLAARDG